MANSFASGNSSGADPDTGLRYWEFVDDQILFRLTQRLPDQTRGFFMARGFNSEDANLIATQCVFQTMFKNISENDTSHVTAILSDWTIYSAGQQHNLKLREYWKELWDQRTTPNSAKIAFDWSLLPSEVSYVAGDYNWGMTSFGLKPGSQFDLALSWKHNGKSHVAKLTGIVCPDDR